MRGSERWPGVGCERPTPLRMRTERAADTFFPKVDPGATMAANFGELMARFRSGDAAAAEELVAEYGPQIRRAIRVRGTGSRLARVLDSEDLLQSVLRTFWVERDNPSLRAENPGQLVRWLLTVARHRRAERGREAGTAKRGGSRTNAGVEGLAAVPAGRPSPSKVVADRELLAQVLARLTPDERRIAEARADGVEWQSLADAAGTTPEALRKQHHRAMARVVTGVTTATS